MDKRLNKIPGGGIDEEILLNSICYVFHLFVNRYAFYIIRVSY